MKDELGNMCQQGKMRIITTAVLEYMSVLLDLLELANSETNKIIHGCINLLIFWRNIIEAGSAVHNIGRCRK